MKKNCVSSLLMLFALSLFLATTAIAAPDLVEGIWEIKGEVKMVGLPFPTLPVPVNFSRCLTKKDIVPQQNTENMNCTILSQETVGNMVTWVMKCIDMKGATTDSTGSLTYNGSTFEENIRNVITDANGVKFESNMQMVGRRIGDCN